METSGAGYDRGEYTTALDYSGSNLIYLGKTIPGLAKSAATWQITKYTYSGANLTDIQYPSGSREFSYIWNDRASYSYS